MDFCLLLKICAKILVKTLVKTETETDALKTSSKQVSQKTTGDLLVIKLLIEVRNSEKLHKRITQK